MKVLCILLSLVAGGVLANYDRKDEAAYLADLPAIIADSYSSPLPSSLAATCVNKGKVQGAPSTVTLSRSMTSAEAQTFCANRYRIFSLSSPSAQTKILEDPKNHLMNC